MNECNSNYHYRLQKPKKEKYVHTKHNQNYLIGVTLTRENTTARIFETKLI